VKTRRAAIVLRDKTITLENIGDACWAELLYVNEAWQAGRSGDVDLNYDFVGGVSSKTVTFAYGDIVRIDLWPGSEEPR